MRPSLATLLLACAALAPAACDRKPPPPAAAPPEVLKAGPPASTLPADAAPAPVATIDAAPAPAEPAAADEPGDGEEDCASTPPRVPTIPPPDRVLFEDEAKHTYGYKDKAGKIVIPARYEMAYEFEGRGVAGVLAPSRKKSDPPFAFIDPTGKIVASAFAFDNGPDPWVDGHARIVDAAGKVGFIDVDGKIVVPPRYDFAYPFCKGVAKVALGGKADYIDPTGKSVPGPPNDDRPLKLEEHRD